MDRLFIVVPCFNESQVLKDSHSRLRHLLSEMIATGIVSNESRFLFIDDGSVDETWSIIEHFHTEDPFSCGMRLTHNAGHQNALMAGMEAALEVGADMIITIDADLQDDISVIPEMVAKWKEGNEVVFGVKKKRETDTWFKRVSAQLYYRFMICLGVDLIYNHADFRLMDKIIVKRLLAYQERNLFLRGIVPSLTNKTSCVYYDIATRKAGDSKYPLGKMIRFALDGLTSFSSKPVQALVWIGLLFIFIAIVLFCYVVAMYFKGKTVSGWPSLMLSIWFVGGCLMIGLGIVGEYIGRIFLEVKGRPRYNIDSKLIR